MEGTTHGLLVNGSLNVIDHVTSRHSAGDGVTINVDNLSSNHLIIVGLNTSDNMGNGLKLVSARLQDKRITVRDCLLNGNGKSGTEVNAGIKITFSTCSLIENEVDGITITGHSNQNNGSMMLTACNIKANTQHAVRFAESSAKGYRFYAVLNTFQGHINNKPLINLESDMLRYSTVVFNGCNITSNIGTFMKYTLLQSEIGKHKIDIVSNNFIKNVGSVLNLKSAKRQIISLEIFENSFKSCHARGPLLELDFNEMTGRRINIEKNRMLSNVADVLVKIGGKGSNFESLAITGNAMIENNVSRAIHFSGDKRITIQENTFLNLAAECELLVPPFKLGLELDARRNYWGYKKFPDVMKRVCSFDINMALSYVLYIPWLLSDDTNDVSDTLEDAMLIENIYGGMVSKSQTLEIQQEKRRKRSVSEIHIQRSIFIRRVKRFAILYNDQ